MTVLLFFSNRFIKVLVQLIDRLSSTKISLPRRLPILHKKYEYKIPVGLYTTQLLVIKTNKILKTIKVTGT